MVVVLCRFLKSGTQTLNKTFEYVAKFVYLGTTLITKNCMHKYIRSILHLGNALESVFLFVT